MSIREHFAKLKAPRRRRRRLLPLQPVIVIARCAVIAGAPDWQEIETFGRKRRDRLKRFRTLPPGSPSHDTVERVFDRLQPQALQACFTVPGVPGEAVRCFIGSRKAHPELRARWQGLPQGWRSPWLCGLR